MLIIAYPKCSFHITSIIIQNFYYYTSIIISVIYVENTKFW